MSFREPALPHRDATQSEVEGVKGREIPELQPLKRGLLAEIDLFLTKIRAKAPFYGFLLAKDGSK